MKESHPTHRNFESYYQTKFTSKDVYESEFRQCIQGKKQTKSKSDKQSSIAWQTANEVTGRKKVHQIKLKVTSQQDRLGKCKGHFQNLSGKSPAVTNHEIETIIHCQCDIKLANFSNNELNKQATTEESLSYQ